jgi:hypothetical protein
VARKRQDIMKEGIANLRRESAQFVENNPYLPGAAAFAAARNAAVSLAVGDIPQASSDLREVGTGILVEVATGKVIEKGAGILGRGLGALGAAVGLGVRGGLSRKIVGTIGLEHSFDEHAAQWFGRQVAKSTHLKAWQELIERVSRSTQVFD